MDIKKLLQKDFLNTEELKVKEQYLKDNKPSTLETVLYSDIEDIKVLNISDKLTAITEDNISYFMEKINSLPQRFNYRYSLEYNNGNTIQPISYIIIKHKTKFFFIIREGNSGEIRLINKVGCIGGHVGQEDKQETYYGTVIEGLKREVLEEVGYELSDKDNIKLIGLLKSEDNTVDRDHLGFIYLLELENDNLTAIEQGVLKGIWLEESELINNADKFENWLKILWDGNMLN